MKLIGFSGLMGSGKSTAAEYMRDMYDYKITSFAAPIKKAAEIIFDLPAIAFSEDGKKVVDPFWGITRREMLQKLGTECMRDVFCQDFWIKRAELSLKSLYCPKVIFDDVRFDDEAAWIRSKGGLVIVVTREGTTKSSHKSENGISNQTHVLVNNGTIAELCANLERMVYDNKDFW